MLDTWTWRFSFEILLWFLKGQGPEWNAVLYSTTLAKRRYLANYIDLCHILSTNYGRTGSTHCLPWAYLSIILEHAYCYKETHFLSEIDTRLQIVFLLPIALSTAPCTFSTCSNSSLSHFLFFRSSTIVATEYYKYSIPVRTVIAAVATE